MTDQPHPRPSGWTALLGPLGVWSHKSGADATLAVRLETLGFGSLWVGGSPDEDFDALERMLDATSTLILATGIVNIWNSDAKVVADSYHRIAIRHPDRFLLGIGAGHPERAGARAKRPLEAIRVYEETLVESGVPRDNTVIAALGPRALAIGGSISAGVHTYLGTPGHTNTARRIVGPDHLVVAEQRVVLEEGVDASRALVRPSVQNPYLGLVNYQNNFRRLGFDESDWQGKGSDALIDALSAHGREGIVDRVAAHLAAGADHVVVQLITGDEANTFEEYGRLASEFGLS
jgi:probable F420-dependent oxidoreductase